MTQVRKGLAFSLVRGVGCAAFRAGVEAHGSAAAAFDARVRGQARVDALVRADAILERGGRIGAEILVQGDEEYPESLLDLGDAPSVLFVLGDRAILRRALVGIVGTRNASTGGERAAHHMASSLAKSGATIVSGMAFGIDAAAHLGALSVDGATVAVLGGGADIPYPPAHAALHAQILRRGLVLSEVPPGDRPVKGAFPRRNRIIAALSELLIVVEAGARSGALITANQALDLGRTVAAVPGPIDSPRHVGTNRLLAAGAAFIAAPDDALALAGLPAAPNAGNPATDAGAEGRTGDGASRDTVEETVLRAVRRGASDPDAVARVTGLSPRELGAALVALELEGLVRSDHGGCLVVTR